MAKEQRKYEKEYKVQAVKLAREIGPGKTAKDLMLQTFEPICCYVFHNNFPERLFLCEIRHNDSQNAEKCYDISSCHKFESQAFNTWLSP